MNDYLLKEEIGRGTMSTVYKGRKKLTINFCAIYSIEKAKRDRVLNNVQVLRSLHHDSIIEFHNWYETANHLWVITELCVGGDLRSILVNDSKMKPASVRLLGADIAVGLFFLHSKGYLYRDLKPGNLLMDSTASLRFYDFGLTCVFGAAAEQKLVGTPLYMAPELFVRSGAKQTTGVPSMAADLWSLGCILYEMAAGTSPFAGKTLEDVLRNVLTQQPRDVPGMSDDFNALVMKLLTKDPMKRATWSDVLACDFWDGALDKLRARDIPTSEPAFAAYRREVTMLGARGADGVQWSEEDLDAAVQEAVAAATANFATSAVADVDDDDNNGEINPRKEVDFKVTSGSSGGSAAGSRDKGRERRSFGVSGSPTSNTAGSRLEAAAHASAGSYGRSRLGVAGDAQGNGSSLASDARRANTYGTGSGTRRASGTPNATTHSSPAATKASSYLQSSERLTRRQLEELGGGVARISSICELAWCDVDTHVRPLCANPRIEKYVMPTFDQSGFTFPARKRIELKGLDPNSFSDFVRGVFQQLTSRTTNALVKENIMRYLETVCGDTDVANTLVNSCIMVECIEEAETKSLPVSLRTAAATVAGLLSRYAVTISPDVARRRVIPRLLKVFEEETDNALRRKVLVCVGELIFYVYAQREDYDRGIWYIAPTDMQRAFISALDCNDDVIRHYAVKTIENLSTSADKAEYFCIPKVVESLLDVFSLPPASSRNTHMRASAFAAALRLATWKESLMSVVFNSTAAPRSTYGQILASPPQPRAASALMGFLIVVGLKCMTSTGNVFASVWASSGTSSSPETAAMLSSKLSTAEAETFIGYIAEASEEVVDKLCESSSRSVPSWHGKALLFHVVLGALGGTLLARLCTSRDIAYLDRVAREEDKYINKCITTLSCYLAVYVSEKLSAVSRRVSSASTPLYLSSVQQILSATTLRERMELPTEAFRSLSECIEKSLSNSLFSSYEQDFNALADRITQTPEAVIRNYEPICTYLVRPYTVMLQQKEEQRRFCALRFLVSVTMPLSTDSRVAREGSSGSSSSARAAVTAAVKAIVEAVNPSVRSLLNESQPVPSYTLRLLVACGICSPTAISIVPSRAVLLQLMGYMTASTRDADVYFPLRLLHLALSTVVRTDFVELAVDQRMLASLVDVAREANESAMEHVQEVCCDLADFMLTNSVVKASPQAAGRCTGQLLDNDGLNSVFLPMIARRADSLIVNEKAAKVVYDIVQASTSAQASFLSAKGIDVLVEVLSTDPINSAAAEWLLKAARTSVEYLSRAELQQKLSRRERLLSALDGVSGRDVPRTVYTEIAKLRRAIKD